LILLTIIAFLFILAFCITIHELGHFLIAKLLKIPVEKFSLGFGPPIIRKQIGETDFRIAYFPLGGYVKFFGDDEGVIVKPPPSDNGLQPQTPQPEMQPQSKYPEFYDEPIWKRISVIFSGPIFNIISAFILFYVIVIIYGLAVIPYSKIVVAKGSASDSLGFITGDSIISINDINISSWDRFDALLMNNKIAVKRIRFIRNDLPREIIYTPPYSDSIGIAPLIPPIIGDVKYHGPAYRIGLRTGDIILSINHQDIKTWEEFQKIIYQSARKTVALKWDHKGEIKSDDITPVAVYNPLLNDTVGMIQISAAVNRIHISPVKSIAIAYRYGMTITSTTINIFIKLLSRKISVKNLGGPISIAQMGGEAASWGLERLIELIAVISINLGIVNLFPLPAFDGGQILIALFEGIRRKRLSQKTRLTLQKIGYAIILLLIILVMYNDITRIAR
jgi:regulator of sigma E protease